MVSFVNQKKAPFFAFSSIVIVTQKTYEFKKNERRFDLPSLIEKGFFNATPLGILSNILLNFFPTNVVFCATKMPVSGSLLINRAF